VGSQAVTSESDRALISSTLTWIASAEAGLIIRARAGEQDGLRGGHLRGCERLSPSIDARNVPLGSTRNRDQDVRSRDSTFTPPDSTST